MNKSNFEWDEHKDQLNQEKHGVSFYEAQHAFFDKQRIIAEDTNHSETEKRFYCFGFNDTHSKILTVRFTYRLNKIRIFGAGYWRKGRKIYEQRNTL